MTLTRQALGLAGWLLLCYAAAGIGAVASMQADVFYKGLTLPSWAPPASVFGPVWTVLYGAMAVAAWLVWRKGGWAKRQKVLTLFLAQLAVNALWSWLFFHWQRGGWALVDIIVLWLLIVATLIGFWRISRGAGLLMVPYLAWVSFASALNLAAWRLNPAVLG